MRAGSGRNEAMIRTMSFGGEKEALSASAESTELELVLVAIFPTKHLYWASVGTIGLIDRFEV